MPASSTGGKFSGLSMSSATNTVRFTGTDVLMLAMPAECCDRWHKNCLFPLEFPEG